MHGLNFCAHAFFSERFVFKLLTTAYQELVVSVVLKLAKNWVELWSRETEPLFIKGGEKSAAIVSCSALIKFKNGSDVLQKRGAKKNSKVDRKCVVNSKIYMFAGRINFPFWKSMKCSLDAINQFLIFMDVNCIYTPCVFAITQKCMFRVGKSPVWGLR